MNFIITWILDFFKPAGLPTPPIKAQRKRKPATKKTATKITVRKKKADK